MDSFFDPKSIVIFGASSNEKKGGNHVLRNILNYTRENIYLIHPRNDEIYGINCYKMIQDLPIREIDLAIIILPIEHVLNALDDCIEFKVKAIILESGSMFIKGDNDEPKVKRIEELKQKLRNYGKTRVMGPNSIGIYRANSNKEDLITSLIYFEKLPGLKKRNLSIISQTGLMLSGILQGQNYIHEIGISMIGAIGNKFDVNESDLLDYFEKDSNTDVIGLYLEDIKDGKRFREQCARIARKKPILLLKSGKTETGKKAIISHTKSLAGDYKIIDALSKQLGIITVNDFNELFTIAKILLSQPIPRGKRIAVISISGAGTVISCDLSDLFGFELPHISDIQLEKMKEIFPRWAWEDVYNPLDIWSAVEYVGPEKAYIHAGETFLANDKYDALIYFLTGIEETEFDWLKLKGLNEKYPDIPIYMVFLGGDKRLLLKWRESLEEKYNIPTFESIHAIFKSLSKILTLKLD